jgi:hypothetical protein
VFMMNLLQQSIKTAGKERNSPRASLSESSYFFSTHCFDSRHQGEVSEELFQGEKHLVKT